MDRDLKEFKNKLQEIKNKKVTISEKKNSKNSGASLGLKIAIDFVITIIVGLFIGIGFDKLFQTSPIFLLIFLFLGIAGAFWNIYRTILNLENKR